MIKFDPITLSDWKTRNIESISIEFISSGCEGTSISIHENMIMPGYIKIPNESSDVCIYSEREHLGTLESAYITHTGKKWILKSNIILTRCSCGSSFGIATGDNKIDKIRLLKSKLAKNKGIRH